MAYKIVWRFTHESCVDCADGEHTVGEHSHEMTLTAVAAGNVIAQLQNIYSAQALHPEQNLIIREIHIVRRVDGVI